MENILNDKDNCDNEMLNEDSFTHEMIENKIRNANEEELYDKILRNYTNIRHRYRSIKELIKRKKLDYLVFIELFIEEDKETVLAFFHNNIKILVNYKIDILILGRKNESTREVY